MDKEKKSNLYKECHLCQSNATFLCLECNYYLCGSCYDLIHSKQKNQSHKKEPLDLFVPIELNCKIHLKDRLNLFCLKEKGKLFIYIIKYRTMLCNVCL